MTDMDDARLEAVLCFREIAGCYLKFAKEAANPTVRGARLRLAAKLEEEAAALNAASNQHSPRGPEVRLPRPSVGL